MNDDDLIHTIWNVLPLLEQFDRSPYSLSEDEIEILRQHHSRWSERSLMELEAAHR